MVTTYGEITESGLFDLFDRVAKQMGLPDSENLTFGATFLDLGSGKGGAVLSSSVRWPGLRTATGIELVHKRHEESLTRFEQVCADQSGVDLSDRVRFIRGDMLKVPWVELVPPHRECGAAQQRRLLVLANTLCFVDSLHQAVLERIESQVGLDEEVFIFCSRLLHDGPRFRRDALVWYEGPIEVSWDHAGIVFQVCWLPAQGAVIDQDAWQAALGNKTSYSSFIEPLNASVVARLTLGSLDDQLGTLGARIPRDAAQQPHSRQRSF